MCNMKKKNMLIAFNIHLTFDQFLVIFKLYFTSSMKLFDVSHLNLIGNKQTRSVRNARQKFLEQKKDLL